MICNPVLTSIMLFLCLFTRWKSRWKQVLQVPRVPVAGSMVVPPPEFHWGATSVHRSGRRLVAGGPVNQWLWWIFMVLGKNGWNIFCPWSFFETWMHLFFWVGHLFWWNTVWLKHVSVYIIYVDYLFIKRMGYPASYPTKHSKCWSMIFCIHSHWWKKFKQDVSVKHEMELLEGITIPKASAL